MSQKYPKQELIFRSYDFMDDVFQGLEFFMKGLDGVETDLSGFLVDGTYGGKLERASATLKKLNAHLRKRECDQIKEENCKEKQKVN